MLAYWWRLLEKLEEDMRSSAELKGKWASFWWPQMQWCREIFLRLFEADFQTVPINVREKIELYMDSLRTTLPCENGGNRLRARETSHQGKRMPKIEKYHALLTSPILSDFERSPVQVTAAAEQCKPKKISDNFFTAQGWVHSMGSEFDRLGKQAEWPTIVHETRMQSFVSFAAFVECDGDWRRHFQLWQGLLAVPNHLIFHKVTLEGSLVFSHMFLNTFFCNIQNNTNRVLALFDHVAFHFAFY